MQFSQEAIASAQAAFPRVDVPALAARTAARLSLPGAKDISQPDAYLFKVCEGSEQEGRYLKGGRAPGAPGPALEHVGFTEEGSVLRSERPIHNAPTQFVRLLLREVKEQLLTPAEVVALISRHAEDNHRLFHPNTIGDWSTRGHIDGWASSAATSSLEECVRSWGGTYPWAKDSYAWSEMRKAWCEREGVAA